MLRYVLTLVVVAALALPAAELSAQDPEAVYAELVGEWERSITTAGGDTFTETLVFEVEDGDIIGVSKLDFGEGAEAEIAGVALEDGTLTFEVTWTFGDQTMTLSYTATIEGDEMTGTVEGGPAGPQEFTAVRATG